MKKRLLAIVLGVYLAISLVGCGASNEQADINVEQQTTATETKEKESMNAFETNESYTIERFSFSVPTYFTLEEDTEDTKTFWDNDHTAMFQANYLEENPEGDINDKVLEVFEGVKSGDGFENATIIDGPTKTSLSSIDNSEIIATVTVQGQGTTTKLVLFREDNAYMTFGLFQLDSSKYDYFSDFDKMISSVTTENSESTVEEAEPEPAEPEQTEEPEVEEEPEVKESSGGVTPEFKETMDDYEEFFDQYIAFMEKYENSDDTVSMMSDYADYMAKYAEVTEELDAIDEDSLSDADEQYYIEVTTRISSKLLKASQ